MRDMLQKPWFVGLLSLVALVFVYLNVVDPMVNDGRGNSSTTAMSNFSNPLSFAPADKPATAATELAAADWEMLARVQPDRNPFTPKKDVKIRTGKRWIAWPTVSAIVIGSSESFAIINGNVVQEGQKSGKFKVVKISANKVRLRYGKREKTLSIDARGGK